MKVLLNNINYGFKTPSFTSSKTNNNGVNKENVQKENFDLNQNQNAIFFKGFFFNKKKPTPPPPPEIGPYGPYNVTEEIIKDNDYDANFTLSPLGGYLNAISDKEKNKDLVTGHRASESTVRKMTPAAIALICYYSIEKTSYPRFYDFMSRAFPKACLALDDAYNNDNMSRVYANVMKKVEEYGVLAREKEEDDPIEAGIKYLYFSSEFPCLCMTKKENSTASAIDNMRKGKPPLVRNGIASPRCHMSSYPNEIRKYGTPYIREHCGLGPNKDENVYGYKSNINFHKRPEEPKVVEYATVEIDPWEYNP